MAYEDQTCPCGGKKARQTLLCDPCETAFAERPELLVYRDPGQKLHLRQHAAQILLTLSRQRKQRGKPELKACNLQPAT